MAYPLLTFEQIRDAILSDWRNNDSMVDVTPDSDNYIRATGIASAILGLYQYQSWGVNQFFPDTADIENLERFGSVRGINRLPAVRAIGAVTFTGNVAANVPAATIVQTDDGRQYSTTAAGDIGGGGTVTVSAQAINAGAAGNLADNTDATLQTAPAGIASAAVIATMGEGFDAESLASLLERVLDHLRHPPAGGHKYDYVKWAREVAGVTSAFAYPLRRGLGTTDVAILTNGAPSTDELRQTVFDYIDARSPAGGEFLVLTPTLVTVNVTANVTLAAGTVLADVQASVESTLAAYFSTLKPGDTVNRSRIFASITDVPGVTDVDLTAPATSVPTLIDATHIQLAALGAVVIS
jgi:uncharacterized phage protein gp47/JayE